MASGSQLALLDFIILVNRHTIIAGRAGKRGSGSVGIFCCLNSDKGIYQASVILADWASFELTFKVVDENDPEAKSGDIWSNYGIEGAQGWRNLGGQAVVYHAPVPASDGNAAHKAVNFSSLKVVSYQYDSRTDKGSLSVNISDYGLEARDWVIKNIGKICSSKEVLLEAGQEKSTGGHYRVLNESLKDGVLTIDFTAGFDSH